MGNDITKHTLLKSIVLHLLPGMLGGICFYFLSPIVKANGYPERPVAIPEKCEEQSTLN